MIAITVQKINRLFLNRLSIVNEVGRSALGFAHLEYDTGIKKSG